MKEERKRSVLSVIEEIEPASRKASDNNVNRSAEPHLQKSKA